MVQNGQTRVVGFILCGAAQTPKEQTIEVVIKYGGGTGRENTATGPHEVFGGEVMPTGSLVTFFVNNANESQRKFNPDAKIASALGRFKAGDLIDIICSVPQTGNGPIFVQSLSAYKLKPGEDDPNGYVFVESFTHKTGDKTINAITLSKYKMKTTYLVPSHPDADGDQVPDDVIEDIAGKLQAGQVVYSTHTGSGDDATITLLAPWANHFTGKFEKFDPSTTVDSNNDTGPAVELINPKNKTITALIPGAVVGSHWVANPDILGAVRALKPDANVEYITANSGDKRIWLINIQPAKPAANSAMSQNMQ